MDVQVAANSYFTDVIAQQLQAASVSTLALMTTSVVLVLTLIAKHLTSEKTTQIIPPHIPSTIPFLGHAVSFGKTPVEFLLAAYHKYGPVFSFTMVGKTFTYLIGSDAASLFFNSRNENLNAEDVYGKLTTPVFGKGVAYDVPNPIFMEQKKMLKTGMNIARFRTYVPMIEEETKEYFKRWGNSGDKDLFVGLSELIILTASRCLHGKEIRSILDEKMAQLYWDLDSGFTAMAWILPHWVPLPAFRRRDDAHKKVKEIFYQVIKIRKESGRQEEDMLQTLIDAEYKSGRRLSDDEIAGILIGLLLGGQHTSSTTGSWLGFFLAKHPEIQQACYEEQLRVLGKDCQRPLDYDDIKEFTLLERCIKETLRLRPPLVTMMRMCKTPQVICGYTIPAGHQVCVSPTTNHRLPDVWDEPEVFKPDRFLDLKGACNEEKFSYVPFGAGRHRCIGESFAYVQIKSIWSTLLRTFEFELADGHFPEVDVTTMIHTPKQPIIRFHQRSTSPATD